jgi:small GTP-binding protein
VGLSESASQARDLPPHLTQRHGFDLLASSFNSSVAEDQTWPLFPTNALNPTDIVFHPHSMRTTGVNFMEKTIAIRNTEITFSIWDLGGQREFVNMLPLVCNDAVAILFMFDLTRKSTLNSIKEWYRQGRGFNKTAIPFLVGTKYDHFVNMPARDQDEISAQAKRFAKAMRASLIFSSTSHSINVQKVRDTYQYRTGSWCDLGFFLPGSPSA